MSKKEMCGFGPEGCNKPATTELCWPEDKEFAAGNHLWRISSVSLFVCDDHIIEGSTKSGSTPPVMPLIIPLGEGKC